MGNSLRCCLACVLPCGALDLVRIVHLSGRVDEYGRAVSAGEVLAAHPNHVLSRPCSSPQGVVRRILIVSPDSELQRGEIYFLIPAASVPDAKKSATGGGGGAGTPSRHVRSKSEGSVVVAAAAVTDRQVGQLGAESPEEKEAAKLKKQHKQQQQHKRERAPAQQHRRRMSTGSHAAPWHPHLACIAEDL